MNDARRDDVLALLSGTATTEELARRHGVSAAEIDGWRSAYVAGLRDAQALAARPKRARWVAMLGAAAAMLLAVGVSWAQGMPSCAQTLPSPLRTFCADDPALADQVNANFQGVVDLIQRKVGAVSSINVAVDGGMSVGLTGTFGDTVTTPQLSLAPVRASLAASAANTIAAVGGSTNALVLSGTGSSPNRALRLQDDVTVVGDLSVQGTLSGGNVSGTLRGGAQQTCNIATGLSVTGCSAWGSAICPSNGSSCLGPGGFNLPSCPVGSTVRMTGAYASSSALNLFSLCVQN